MEDKIYKVRKRFKYSNLGKYGFYKTEPKDTNPWYQCPIWIDLNCGLGMWHECIDINKETHEAIVECDYNKWSNTLKEKFDSLIKNNIVITS